VSIPPREVLARETREAIECHDKWDSPHSFATLHWDGEKLRTGHYATIMTDVPPDRYPALMAGIAREQLEKEPGDPAYAYLLQVETYGVTAPGPGAGDEERRQFDADRRNRTFHQRADATENAVAWCADIHGRLWAAAKKRGAEAISERFYTPGKAPRGQFISALLATAATTGASAYGLRPNMAGETWN
jgi:hypothetical protein